MKYVLSVFLALVLVIDCSYGQSPTHKVVTELDFDYLEGCETGKGDCTPLEIVRTAENDTVVLIFPSGGTESDVYLHSKTDPSLQLHDKRFTGQGKPTLLLTSLKDGEYVARIVSCGLGGACIIRLKTQTK